MSRPLRLLVFSTLFPSASRPGHGIFVRTRLRELMRSHDVQAQVVAPVPWFPFTAACFGEHARMAATPRHEEMDGLSVWHPRYPLPPRIGMNVAPLLLALGSWPTVSRLQRQGFDFDAIDAHYFYPDGVAAALLARWSGRPLTITARGSDVNLIAQYRAPRLMMAWAARQAAACIGVSAALVERLREIGAPAERLHTMRNGVDLERFAPLERMPARAALGLQGQPLLLMVGHLVDHKGPQLAIEALDRLRSAFPGAHLCIVGDGPQRPALQAQIDRLRLAACVTLQPAVPQSELPRWYSAADVLVLASSREGWPNVLLEAMACGTPVVSTTVGGTPEIVSAPQAGRLVPAVTAPALAEGLVDILSRPPLREQVRQHAQRFSWAETSRAQYDVFARLVAHPQEWARA